MHLTIQQQNTKYTKTATTHKTNNKTTNTINNNFLEYITQGEQTQPIQTQMHHIEK